MKSSRWGRYSGQPGGDPGGWWAPSHAAVEHGILNLETYRDPRFRHELHEALTGGTFSAGWIYGDNVLPVPAAL